MQLICWKTFVAIFFTCVRIHQGSRRQFTADRSLFDGVRGLFLLLAAEEDAAQSRRAHEQHQERQRHHLQHEHGDQAVVGYALPCETSGTTILPAWRLLIDWKRCILLHCDRESKINACTSLRGVANTSRNTRAAQN